MSTSANRERAEADSRERWADFYRRLHEWPVAATYRDLFAPDVEVRDTVGHWIGVADWSAHEREAICLGVRACLLGVYVGDDVAILELDFMNPVTQPDHCPSHATFVHHVRDGRSTRLRIHYPSS